jgi:hypothetical protein
MQVQTHCDLHTLKYECERVCFGKIRAYLGLCIDIGAAFDKARRCDIATLVCCMMEGGPVGGLEGGGHDPGLVGADGDGDEGAASFAAVVSDKVFLVRVRCHV